MPADLQQLVVALGAVRDDHGGLLLGLRADSSVPGAFGKWELPGGKVDFGERPEQAVKREVSEECGLEIIVLRLLPEIFTHVWRLRSGAKAQPFMFTYECQIIGGRLRNNTPEEIKELRFFSLEEAAGLDLLPNVSACLTHLS